jgi:hypothetical protein
MGTVNKGYFTERLSEPSTWRGLLAVLTACGIAFSPEQADKIVAGGLALIGLVGAFTKDKE